MERIFYQQLANWKSSGMKKPLLVLGARQVGKTFAIDMFCSQEFVNYHQVNLLENPALGQIYQSELSSASKFEQLQMLVGSKLDNADTVLFVDELQESEGFIADLKYLQEKQPQVNIVCAGSLLGVKLKRLKRSFPVGKVSIRNMYPLCFMEFLMALGKQDYIPVIQQCYEKNAQMFPALHQELLRIYRIYTCIGGMPEIIQHYLDNDQVLLDLDLTFFDDLKTAYIDDMKKYVSSQNEAVKIERVYNSISLQQSNLSHKFQYSKVRSGARASQYDTALDWLIAANLVCRSECVTNPEKPIRYFAEPEVFKLFLCDLGMMTHSLGIKFSDIMLERIGQPKGLIAENYVACEFSAQSVPLHYWRSEHNAEVDFLVEMQRGVIPVEVKSADNTQSKSLGVYCRKYQPAYAIRLSTKNFGFTNNIKSVPLYAAFCLMENE
jgi:predicted AAA+ superfamily ATPase